MFIVDVIIISTLVASIYKMNDETSILDGLYCIATRYLHIVLFFVGIVSIGLITRGELYIDEMYDLLLTSFYYLTIITFSIPVFCLYRRYVARNKLYYLGSTMLRWIFWGLLITIHVLTAIANIFFT
jgi:hypothetical protein